MNESGFFFSAGSGEREETFKTGPGLWFRGGRGRGVGHSAFTENCKEEVNAQQLQFEVISPLGKTLLFIDSLITLTCVSCRGRRGSQGSEPYSPYDFSEEQNVPESKHHFYHVPTLLQSQ